MKKLLTVLLTLLMVFTLVGCNSKEDTPVVQEPEKQEVVEETKEEPEIVGGYVDVEDGTLTDELKDIFAKALEGLLGATYEPQELVATQVVAGTNYKFLANGTKTTNPITKGTYYITIYKDLQGNVSLLDIETIEEKQEETASTDPSEYSYWVVFKNPDGNELQRTIEKYGTTPEYVGDTPVYWDSDYWYRFTNWDKELKPITTNTYITAEYEMGGPLKKEETTVTPAPSGLVTVTFIITDGNEGNGYMQKDPNTSHIPSGTQIQFPIGANYSTNGNEITINGEVYTAFCDSTGSFAYWEVNDSQDTSGQITENSTITAMFYPV